MSKLLIDFVLLNTKVMVNTYTAATLPFYYLYQRPWQKLRAAKDFGVKRTVDRWGRVIYTRDPPQKLEHPYYKVNTFPEIFPTLDRSRLAIGVRDVIKETMELDKDGKPMIVDDKELTKIELSKEFRWLSVGEMLDKSDTIARGMREMGIKKGDKVTIYAETNVEWFLCALALTRLNAITVTLFPTLGDAGVLYGMNQSESKYLIITETLLKKLEKIRDKTEYLEKVIYVPNRVNSERIDKVEIEKAKENLKEKFNPISLDDVEKRGSQIPPCEFAVPELSDVILIMYTSGTTGNPKGVILTHKQFQQSLMNMLKIDEEFDYLVFKSRFAAYLPMAHLFGYLLNIGLFLTEAQIAMCSPFTLLNSSPSHVEGQVGDIKLIQPEMFATVPLVLERVIKEIYRKLNARSPIAAPIFTYLMDYKIRWTQRGFDTPIINKLVCKRINDEFGGKLKMIGVSSAPIHEHTQALAQAALNAKVFQAYGATEVCGGSHTMHITDMSLGRTGIPYASAKVYLEDWKDGDYLTSDKPNPRGEIIIGGDTVAEGYYKMPNETAESFFEDEDGTRWFRTGDIGEMFPDGTLKIIDRKKDLTKLANGEFVSLGKIESGLRACNYIENICVCTDPYSNDIMALISPNLKALNDLAKRMNKSHLTTEQLCNDKEISSHIFNTIKSTCIELDFKKKEIPYLIRLVKEEWSQENNLLTAAFKMRRKQVYDFYSNTIKEMFDQIKQEKN